MTPLNTRILFATCILLLLCTGDLFAQSLPRSQQIAAAVSPLPTEFQDGARVLGFDEAGVLRELRAGSNEMTCLADEPGDERFHVACYHNALEPFMSRGRALREAGKSPEEVLAAREQEIANGTLQMPDRPVALYSLTGAADAYDADSGAIIDPARLYVVYLPYATEASTGLSSVPAAGTPWLMDSGKPWAHIMLMSPGSE